MHVYIEGAGIADPDKVVGSGEPRIPRETGREGVETVTGTERSLGEWMRGNPNHRR